MLLQDYSYLQAVNLVKLKNPACLPPVACLTARPDSYREQSGKSGWQVNSLFWIGNLNFERALSNLSATARPRPGRTSITMLVQYDGSVLKSGEIKIVDVLAVGGSHF